MSLPADGTTQMDQVWAPLRDVAAAVVEFEAHVKERFAALHTLLQQQHQALEHLQQQQLHETDVTRRLLQRREAHCSSLAAELREARHRHQAEVTALAQQRWRDAAVSRAARMWLRKVEARRAGDGREQARALQSANAALRHELEALQRAVRASLLLPAQGAAGAYPASTGGLYDPPASPSLSNAGTTDTGEDEPSSPGPQKHQRRPLVGESSEEDRAGQQRGPHTDGAEPHTEGGRTSRSEPQHRATQTDAEQQHPPRQQQPQQTHREPSQRTQEPLLPRHGMFPPEQQRQHEQQFPVIMDYSENYLAQQQVEAQQRLQQPLPSLRPQHQNQQAQFQQNPRFVANASQASLAQQPAAHTQSSSVRPLMDYRPDALRDESRARLQQLRQQRWPRPSLSALQRLNDNLRRAGADGGVTGAVCDGKNVTHVHVCHCLGDRREAAVEAVKENRPVMCPQCNPVQNSNFNHKIDVGKKSAPGKGAVRTGGEVRAGRERRDLPDNGNWNRGEQKVSVTKPVMESVVVERHRVV